MAEKSNNFTAESIAFLRRRDYRFIKELGQGACGRTVLFHDDMIDEVFVCKKYTPYSETHRAELFQNFVREIKILHQLYHDNLVRVFNYYIYPEHHTGYILMEFVSGSDIEDFCAKKPETASGVFRQVIGGFRYLESRSILHRDIRPGNILVRADGVVKVIDLGFGKRIENSTDFNKSISLNWWCEPPSEFGHARYDFKTEVYFVGKLFQKIIADYGISQFKYMPTLGKMCQRDPAKRIESFAAVENELLSNQFDDVEFSGDELESYRSFSTCVSQMFSKLERGIKYIDDVPRIMRQLEESYRSFMLEAMCLTLRWCSGASWKGTIIITTGETSR